MLCCRRDKSTPNRVSPDVSQLKHIKWVQFAGGDDG